ncbi:MAG: restriction endonuclease subunit S, partial [Patescibacteria group bacterium]|nr:restriction endonuclease subunit S [Patescibacteria group bacterium]
EKFMTDSNNWLDKDKVSENRYKVFPVGTIIFPKIGGAISTNKKRILTRDSIYDNNVMGLVPTGKIFSGYLYWWLYGTDINSWANGSSLPAIKKTTVEETKIPLPPLAEQKKIARELDVLAEKVRKLRQLQGEVEKELKELKKAVLREAFEGSK